MTTTLPAQVGMLTPVTRLQGWAQRAPGQVALRRKAFGVWQDISFAEYWQAVEEVANGLIALGVEPGERVAIHSENRPEWLYLELGTMAVRGASVGVYPTNPPPEVEHLLADSGAVVLFAEDQEQVDKALSVRVRLPQLRRIIYLEPRGIRAYPDAILMSWEDFRETGRQHRQAKPTAVPERMAAAHSDDLATLIYTSGTTGPPKGSILKVGNIEYALQAIAGTGGLIEPSPGPGDLILSYLPLCHVYERAFSVWFTLAAGTVVNFAESIDTVIRDLRETQPSIFQGVPRIFEKLHAGVLIGAAQASFTKRLTLRTGLALADRIGKSLARTGGRPTPVTRGLAGIGWLVAFRALKERLGLRRCRYAVTASAPIAPEIIRFFMGIGVPVFEAYGLTETAALATGTRPGRVRLGSVGEAYGGAEIKLHPISGEVLIRHPGVFAGYWGQPAATAAALDGEGWLHTGDVGEWLDGSFLKIVDRIKDIIITAGGKNISPSAIENSLKTSPFIKEAVVIGDRRPFLTALIGIDFDIVSKWAQRSSIAYTTYRDLTEKPAVIALIQGVVDQTNSGLSRVEQVKRFRLLAKELDHDQGELTATQKVKRKALEDKFTDLIEAMYR